MIGMFRQPRTKKCCWSITQRSLSIVPRAARSCSVNPAHGSGANGAKLNGSSSNGWPQQRQVHVYFMGRHPRADGCPHATTLLQVGREK
jgi:hypothetical protein